MLGINVVLMHSINGKVLMMSANSERVKRWRDANRALWNLRRRNARKKLSGVEGSSDLATERPDGIGHVYPDKSTPSQTSKEETLSNLRSLIKAEEEKPVTEARASEETRSVKDVVGGIYRNDHGGVISKFAYEKLQKLKEKAKNGGYQLDDYSQ